MARRALSGRRPKNFLRAALVLRGSGGAVRDNDDF